VPLCTVGMTMYRMFLLGICGICLWPIGALAQSAEGIDATSPEPVAAFLERCYEPIRLTGKPKLPVPDSDPGWAEADEAMRAALDVKMPNEVLRVHPPGEEGGLLAVQHRKWVLAGLHGSNPDKHETRQRCRIVFEGDDNVQSSATIKEALEEALGGVQGARDYEVLKRCGYRKPRGWDQWLWSAMARRNASRWSIEERRGRSHCTRATTDRFYTKTEMIHIHLFVRERDPRVGVIELIRTFRPDRDSPKGKPKVSVHALGAETDQDKKEKREDQGKEK